MLAIFNHFIRANPGARDKVRAIVIDKDSIEWRVLLEAFPATRVLLCQLLVLKWFGYVVTVRQYTLSVALRDEYLSILEAMVYTGSCQSFDSLRRTLNCILADTSLRLLSYMEERWYSCRQMWSGYVRTTVFAAMNTTTSRIESSWN